MKKGLFLTGLLIFLLQAAAFADYKEGMSAYWRNEYPAAFQAFQTAAEQGEADAQFMLGKMYADGLGTVQDYVSAHKWLNLAASQGKSDAAELRDRIAERMTPEQLAQAQRLAVQWVPSGKPPEPSVSEVPAPTRAEIAQIQEHLSKLGYAPGVADGLVGENTRSAIRQYQASAGLPVDGQPTTALLAHLENAHAALQQQPETGQKKETAGAAEADGTDPIIEKLRSLAAEVERKNAAEGWVVDEIRSIVREYDWSWPNKVAGDTFSDGDYTQNPSWNVGSGLFYADPGVGLTTRVTVAPARPQQGKPQKDNLPLAILGAILEQQTGGVKDTATAEKTAEIYLPRKIGNAFAVRLVIRSRADAGRLEFGPYYGGQRDRGYRLACNIGAESGLELLRLSGSGSAVVDVLDTPLNLSDGLDHTIQWSRDQQGQMVVTVDDKVLLSVDDRRYTDVFSGFTILNKGGEYTLRKIEIFDAGQGS